MNEQEIRTRIVRHEGRRARVYADPLGHPTIGVGFNLDRYDAREALARVGAEYGQVRSGNQILTDQQIDSLLAADIATAELSAKTLVPAFGGLPDGAQSVLVDLAFQLGREGLRGFKKFLAAVQVQDWARAAYELCSSKLALQTPVRVIDNLLALLRP